MSLTLRCINSIGYHMGKYKCKPIITFNEHSYTSTLKSNVQSKSLMQALTKCTLTLQACFVAWVRCMNERPLHSRDQTKHGVPFTSRGRESSVCVETSGSQSSCWMVCAGVCLFFASVLSKRTARSSSVSALQSTKSVCTKDDGQLSVAREQCTTSYDVAVKRLTWQATQVKHST